MARAATTADAFNAVAEPRRRQILDVLASGERPVNDLVLQLGLAQPQVSKHLRVLREVGAVDVRESGRQRLYRLNGNALKPVFDAPVKRGKWWSLWSMDSGVYHLEIDPESSEDPLWVSFLEIRDLEPNERFSSLEELKTFMKERGAVVDCPDEATDAQ